MDMIHGQTYEIKSKMGYCCECFKGTTKFLHNAKDYFCLSDKCFLSRKRYLELLGIRDRLDEILSKLKGIANEE